MTVVLAQNPYERYNEEKLFSERRKGKICAMISILLMEKIAELFLMMLLGFVIVRAGVLRSGDSVVLSKICLYLVMPCVIIHAFQVDFKKEVQAGLLLAFAAALVIHVLLMILCVVLRKTFAMTEVEVASVIYSNAGNLIIPIVTGVLGQEWVIYSSAFLSVQLVFVWTHGKLLFSGEKKPQLRKILLNPNMIAVYVGFFLLFSGLRFPAVLDNTISSVGNMVGPVSMMITGMLVAGMPFRQLFAHKRIYLVVFLRMVFCPAMVLVLIKLSHAAALIPDGKQVLLITLLATMTPAASTITQFAQLYQKDAEYAGAINIFTTLVCIVTMPVFVGLYMM